MVNVPSIAVSGLLTVAHQTITVEARTGSHVDGAWVDAAPTTSTAQATVQPARGRDLLRLPEGRRGSEAIRVITPTALVVAAGAGNTRRADVIVWNGQRYEVEAVETYDGAHYDAIAVRTGD